MSQYQRIRDLGHDRARACLERAVTLKRQLEEAVPAELLMPADPLLAAAPLEVMAHLVILRESGPLEGVRVGLVRVETDRLAAWFEAALYFPLELFVDVADDFQAEGSGLQLALQAGARIFLTHETRLALDGSRAVLFGEAAGNEVEDEDGQWLSREAALDRYAAPDVRILEADRFPAALFLQALERA